MTSTLLDAKESVGGSLQAANNWPLYAALRNKLFEESGTGVEVIHISSSKQQMKGLIDSEYDIIHTAADNVVAIHAEPDYAAVSERPKIFMGGDDGFLTVHSSRSLGSFDLLRGREWGSTRRQAGSRSC